MTKATLTAEINAPWLQDQRLQRIFDALIVVPSDELWLVGGCVRNALINAPVGDIDLSTNLTPNIVSTRARVAELAVIPTGIEHGTVTVVSDGLPVEITTYRKDVATDGRRATVAFAQTMAEDAQRRDFTMNALYADRTGRIVDPLGGLSDLYARRLRFIGDATERIREDYLRSLRFFRFYAWYADPEQGFDPEALSAIASNLDGLDQLSRERVGSETLKLLSATDPSMGVAGMRLTGVLSCILPGADDKALAPLVHLEQDLDLPADPIRRLTALSPAGDLPDLRLSRAQSKELSTLRTAIASPATIAELAYRHGREFALNSAILRAVLMETPLPTDLREQTEQGSEAHFPVAAKDLMPNYSGPALGQRLRDLEARWIASGFTLSRDALLSL